MDTVADKLKAILADCCFLEDDEAFDIRPESVLGEDIGMDSLAAVEAILAAEETFEINIDDDRAVKCRTFQDAVDMVVQCLAESARE